MDLACPDLKISLVVYFCCDAKNGKCVHLHVPHVSRSCVCMKCNKNALPKLVLIRKFNCQINGKWHINLIRLTPQPTMKNRSDESEAHKIRPVTSHYIVATYIRFKVSERRQKPTTWPESGHKSTQNTDKEMYNLFK